MESERAFVDAVCDKRPLSAPRGRLLLRVGSLGLVVAIVAFWVAILRPVSLGGPTGYTIVSGRSMEPTLRNGDLVVTFRQGSYAVGDVVVYEIPASEPGAGVQVIHRVVGGSEVAGFVVQGDNKDGVDPWRPQVGDVVGEVRLTMPRAGLVLLFLRTPLGFAILAGLTTLFVALTLIPRSDEEQRGRLS